MQYHDYENELKRESAGFSPSALSQACLASLVRHWKLLEGRNKTLVNSEVHYIRKVLEAKRVPKLEDEELRILELCDIVGGENASEVMASALSIAYDALLCLNNQGGAGLTRAYDLSLGTAESLIGDDGPLEFGPMMRLSDHPTVLHEVTLQFKTLRIVCGADRFEPVWEWMQSKDNVFLAAETR